MAASETVSPLTTADITEEIWREVARETGNATMTGHLALRRQPAISVGQPAPSLPVLLGQEDAAFVEAAYAAILHRAPDAAGSSYFLREMAAGRSKIVLLGQLRNSAEGKRLGVTIPGLRRRYMAHRVYALPLIGPVARIGAAIARRTGVSHTLAGRPQSKPGGLQHRLGQQQAAIDLLSSRLAALQTAYDASRRAAANSEYERRLGALDRQALRFDKRLAAAEDSAIASLLAIADRVTRLESLGAAQDENAIAARIDAGTAALRQTFDERLARAEAIVAQNRQDVIDQQRRIGLILETLRRRADAPVSQPEFAALDGQDDHVLDSLYVAFEDRFRGTRADIKQRQRFYLPILAESQAGTPDRPIVDVGCGRGEFLELMRDAGLTARGVDANESMAEACRAIGLDCVAGDALAYLARQTPGSLGAVTGFHIIEHLPFKVMVRLFDEALRALAPDGVMVFETPNPANLLVASRWFYMDPTHRNPLPGEMVAMIAEARGFVSVSIVDLHPSGLHFPGNDPVLQAELDRIFHGPQDYALLARKP